MFIKDIKLLELELHSYCNRQCSFCPNSYIDRHSETYFLDDDVLLNLLDELKNKDFKGVISLSRYNEPFAKIDTIIEGVDLIKKYLPDVKIVTNTNGDYDYSKLKDKIEITEMDYDNNKDEIITSNFRIMKLKKINNRAGALNIKKEFNRDFHCYEPQRFIGINYDGTVSPCCNVRNDIDNHKPYIMGDLHNDSLYNILNYNKNKGFRNNVANMIFPVICKHCDKQPGRYTSDSGIGGKQT